MEHTVFLPPASAVEVIESDLCVCVCVSALSRWTIWPMTLIFGEFVCVCVCVNPS